jgi:hypothetical protein
MGHGFAGGVVVEAAPAVVFRFGDEPSGDRVSVNVLDFLFELGCREDVKVVVAGLPEVVARSFEDFGGFSLDDSEC